jgi:hypothetical protein
LLNFEFSFTKMLRGSTTYKVLNVQSNGLLFQQCLFLFKVFNNK